jgi:hypothetical protein
MEWSDILIKVGVGSCLGFGIIVLAKLGKKKNKHDQKTSNSGPALSKDTTSRADAKRKDH